MADTISQLRLREKLKEMCTYRQILECIDLLQIIIELLKKKIEYSIYIYGAPDRAVFPKIYSEFI